VSGLVVLVLGILLALGATAIVFGALRPFILSIGETSSANTCLKVQISPVLCHYNGTLTSVVVERKAGVGSLKEIKFIFKNSSGASVNIDRKTENFTELERRSFSFSAPPVSQPVSVDLAPVLNDGTLCSLTGTPFPCIFGEVIDQPTACNDGEDNDGDGWFDVTDPGCPLPQDDNETNDDNNGRPACSNEADDADPEDTLIDGNDPGCTEGPGDLDETDILPQCSDGIDNDNDTLIDYGSNSSNDPGCADPIDDDETNIISGALDFCTGFGDDRDLLYNVTINLFTKADGTKSFNAIRKSDGLVLRQNFSDEKFFGDNSNGALTTTYSITPTCGGVDITYSVQNPTSQSQNPPNLRVDGIMQVVSGDFYVLDIKDAGFTRRVTKPNGQVGTLYLGSNGLDGFGGTGTLAYPNFYYSPVIVAYDNSFSVGTGIQYPYLNYKHDVVPQLARVTSGLQTGTWRHEYREFKPLMPANQQRTYTISVRFTKPSSWIVTLDPYKKYFKQTYGNSQQTAQNRHPIHGVELAYSQFYNAQTNPRSYQSTGYFNELPSVGWGSFVDGFIAQTKALGYERAMIWTPSGLYNPQGSCTSPENQGSGQHCNYPPAFMDFLPHLDSTAGNFSKFAQNNLELGFWWGRSGQTPNPEQWNPTSISNADYENAQQISFLTNQLLLAKQRNAKTIGLDYFGGMPAFQRDDWIDDMKSLTINQVLFVHEGSGPDFLHRKMGNFYWPSSYIWWTQYNKSLIESPDVLSHYLNKGSEIWTWHRDTIYWNLNSVQKMASYGFTPVYFGYPTQYSINVANLDYDLVECFNDFDDDSDGDVDWPYDDGCDSATDTSETE